MRAYKVVRVHREESGVEYLSSFIVNEYAVRYIPDKWIEPKIGKLFCYKENRDILLPYRGYEIWEAEIIPSDIQDINIVNPYIAGFDSDMIYLFWNDKLWDKKNRCRAMEFFNAYSNDDVFDFLPDNTILADKVKLLQKVL